MDCWGDRLKITTNSNLFIAIALINVLRIEPVSYIAWNTIRLTKTESGVTTMATIKLHNEKVNSLNFNKVISELMTIWFAMSKYSFLPWIENLSSK